MAEAPTAAASIFQLFLSFRSQHSRDRLVIHREYLIEGDIDLAAATKAFGRLTSVTNATALCAARQCTSITDQNIFLYCEGDRSPTWLVLLPTSSFSEI